MRKSMWSRERMIPLLMFGMLLLASGLELRAPHQASSTADYACCEGEVCQDQDCRLCDLARRMSVSPEKIADFRQALVEDSFCGPDQKICCCSSSR